MAERTDAITSYPTLVMDHERLDAYRVAEQLDDVVVAICERAPRGYGWLLDQIQRASGSVALNIAEGIGRSGNDRLQHLRIARGSANETDAGAALMERRKLVRPLERAEVKHLASRVVAMLTKMLQA
jgi:four helix bundle protein